MLLFIILFIMNVHLFIFLHYQTLTAVFILFLPELGCTLLEDWVPFVSTNFNFVGMTVIELFLFYMTTVRKKE